MSVSHKIKFYPVDNGDNVLLKLDDNTTVIVDCQIREGKENSDGITIYDVKKDLLNELSKDSNKNPFVDLFINTHPHQDHCLGFGKNYYHGSPDDYTETNRKNGEIIIGELWVTQMFFSNNLSDDASDVRKEAKRRRKLFEDGSKESSKYGNRLKIIGYNDEDKTVDGLHYVPGNTIEIFNGKKNEYLSIFIHAPFKSDLVRGKADKDKNATSIVVQMQLRTKKNGEIKSKIIIGGDADHYVWEQILDKSKNHNNEDKLNWDLFLAPHHCSWTFF
jgi:metal-dependent hydrolase (beta-lactamase superfamily II)